LRRGRRLQPGPGVARARALLRRRDAQDLQAMRRRRPAAVDGAMQSYLKSLRSLAERYRRAEMEIVSAYFAKPRSRKQHVHWLKAQGFKEHAAIKPLLKILASFYSRFDGEVDRHDFEAIA